MDPNPSAWCLTPSWLTTPAALMRICLAMERKARDPTCMTAFFNLLKPAVTRQCCSWNYIIGGYNYLKCALLPKASTYYTFITPFCSSTRESSCLTVVLNNLRVFLILEWLQLVQNFLRVPVVKPSSSYKTCYYHPSQTNPESATAALSSTETIMPKTVKSGVVTKRSTVAVTQDRCLDVKVNVTGETTMVMY